MHIYYTTGCSPLRNVFIIFCYGLLRPDKTQHSEVPTDLPSHTPQISHLFIRVYPVVHNYKAMCVCVSVCLLCFLNIQYPSTKYVCMNRKSHHELLKGQFTKNMKILSLFTHPCVVPNLKAFLSSCPYSESQWGPMLFRTPLTFTVWTNRILQNCILLYSAEERMSYKFGTT